MSLDRLLIDIEVSLHNVDTKFKVLNNILKRTGSSLARVHIAADGVGKSIQKAQKHLIGFGLSALFTGMAIKNFAQGIIKDLGNTFMILADEQNEGVKRMLEMQAALQFLKFVLFDVFANSDLFGIFVEFLVNAVNMLSEFIQTHRGLAIMFGILLAMGVVFGGISMIVGQLALGFLGILELIAIMGAATLPLTGIFLGIVLAVALIGFFLTKALGFAREHPGAAKRWEESVNRLKLAFGKLWNIISDVAGLFGINLPDAGKTAFISLIIFVDMLSDAIERISDFLDGLKSRFIAIGKLFKGDFAGGLKAFNAAIDNTAIKQQSLITNREGISEKFNRISDEIDSLGIGFKKTSGKNSFGISGTWEVDVKNPLLPSFAKIPTINPYTGNPMTGANATPLPSQALALPTNIEGFQATLNEIVGLNSPMGAMKENTAKANEILESLKTDGFNFNDNGVQKLSKAIGGGVGETLVNLGFGLDLEGSPNK